jgi:hypothetical protein
MDGVFTTTVQFPSKRDYKKLKMLSVLNSRSVGEQIQLLVNSDLDAFSKTEIRKALKDHPDLIQVLT